MADESLNPEAKIAAEQLERTLRGVDAHLTQEAAVQRERDAKADAREARAQARAQKAEAKGTARAAGAPTEKAAIDEAVLSTERLVRANAEALAAVRARVAVEREEGVVIARNAEATAAAAARVQEAVRWRIPSEQPVPTMAGISSEIARQKVARVAAQQQQEEVYAARMQAAEMGRRGRELGPGPAIQPQGLLGPGPAQRLLGPGRPQALLGAGPSPEQQAAKTAAALKEVAAAQQVVDAQQARSAAATQASTTRIAKLDQQLQYLSRSYNLAGDAAAKHGLLTSETINYMLKGQISARQFGNEIAGTITKFAGWTAAATATYGIIGILSQFTKGAIAAASGVGLVSRVMNNVDSSKLQQQFRDLSAQFNLPIGDVVQAVYGSAKLYNDQADAINAATVALFGMKVGELSAAESTQTLNSIVNGFGLTASELPAVLDTINQAQNRFGGNVGQIEKGVGKAAGAFRLAGGNFRELTALIETGTKVSGSSGENVATALARSASRILTPQGAAALREVGITPGGGIMDVLRQAFDLSEKATPEQVNAIARAIVPSGGQFARIIVPILQNRAKYEEITAGTTEEQSRGSAARELAKALGQPDEQMRALVNGVQRLGAAFAQAGGANGLLIIVKALQTALTLTTSFVEAVAKIPGIQVALPFVELLGVLKVLKFFNLGGSLPTPTPGTLRARAQGWVTQGPDKQFATQIEKDQGAVGQLAAQESQASQLRARRANLTAKRLEQAAMDDSLTAEQRVVAQARANTAYAAAEDATRDAALMAEETAAIAQQNLVYERARKAGMTAEAAATKAGIYYRTGTIDFGKGGTPVPIPVGREGHAIPGTMPLFDEAGKATEVVKETEIAGAAIAATAIATKKGAEGAAQAAVASEEVTRAGYARMVLTTKLSMSEMVGAVLVGFRSMGLAAKEAGVGGVAAGAVGVGRVAGMTGLRAAGGALASTRASLAGVGALGTTAFTAAGGFFLIKTVLDQAKQYDDFLKLANAKNPDLDKIIQTARENADRSKPSTILADFASLQVGKGLSGALQADQDAFSTIWRSITAGSGKGSIAGPGGALAGAETRNQAEQEAAVAAQDAKDSLARAQSKDMLLTQSQISARVRQRLSGTTTPGEQLEVYNRALNTWEEHSLAQLNQTPGALAARARNIAYLKGQIALVEARTGDFVALAKVLADGTLKTEDLTKEIAAQISAHGVTGRTLQFARYNIAQAVTNIGARTIAGDIPGAAAAAQSADATKQAILEPASADLQNALALATTPAETGAARKKFRDIYRTVTEAPLLAIHNANAEIAKEQARRPDTFAPGFGDRDNANIRKQLEIIKDAKKKLSDYRTAYQVAMVDAEKSQRADEFTRMDTVASLREARTSDPVEKERIALANIDAKIAKLRKDGREHSTEMIQLYLDRYNTEKANSDDAVAAYQSAADLADSAAAIGATQGENLTRAVAKAQDFVAFLKTQPGITTIQMQGALRDVNLAKGALADYMRGQSIALIGAKAEFASSGTTDPVKLADIKLQADIEAARYAQTPAEQYHARAQVRTDRQARRMAGWQARQEDIQFQLDMGRISSDTAAGEIEALARRVKGNKQYKQQLEVMAKNLRDSAASSSNYELNVGNIKFPTAYEVMRGIGEANKASSRTLSTGNVHATANATINVNVANRSDVGAVSDAIDTVLSTHVRSTLRAKGVIGG